MSARDVLLRGQEFLILLEEVIPRKLIHVFSEDTKFYDLVGRDWASCADDAIASLHLNYGKINDFKARGAHALLTVKAPARDRNYFVCVILAVLLGLVIIFTVTKKSS